jgi:hypothetical protein
VLSKEPAAIQLRYLSTLYDIGADKNSTIVFPMPLDLLSTWMQSKTPPAAPRSRRT